ncbi:MAG: flagellar hook-length control protein FliK [Chloroflexi bacterium]|nr:flagellar hook-length control protein FliK [Chloroflexota bacterium]
MALHQTLRATVLDVVDGRALLDLGSGQKLWASTNLNLPLGAQVMLRVQEITPQQVALQLVSPEGDSADAVTRPDAQWVGELLTTLSIADDGVNRAIALELIQQGLAVEPDLVSHVRAALESLAQSLPETGDGENQAPPVEGGSPDGAVGGPDAGRLAAGEDVLSQPLREALPAVVRLTVLRLPITSQTVALASTWTDDVPPWDKQTSALLSALADTLAVEPEGNGQTSSARPLLTQVMARVAAWPLQGDQSLAGIAEQVRHVLEELGTSVEYHLLDSEASLPAGEQTAPRPATPAQPPDATASLPATTTETTPPLTEGVPNLVNQVSAGRPAVVVRDQILLYQLRELATRVVDDAGTPPAQREAWQQLTERVDSVLQHVQGEHLFNVRQPAAHVSEPFYIFPLPLAAPDGLQAGQVRIYWQTGSGADNGPPRVDPRDVRLLFRLNVSGLGPVEIDLVVWQNRVRAHFRSDSEPVRALSRQHAGDLRLGLGRLGFSVEQLHTSVLTTQVDRQDPPGNEALPAARGNPAMRVDARA